MPKCNFNKTAKELYRNHTSTLMFSCKFAAYFQTRFLLEHLWRAASEGGIIKQRTKMCFKKQRCTVNMFIQEYFTFFLHDLRYILISLIRKGLAVENKIRNQSTLRSLRSNMIRQHGNVTNE